MRDFAKTCVFTMAILCTADCGRSDAERRGVASLNVTRFDGLGAAEYLARGGQPAAVWLAGAVVGHPRVRPLRTPGRGAAGLGPAARDVDVTAMGAAEALEADVSQPVRLTWGCGGDFEFREAETAHPRLVAETVVVCGAHQLNDTEIRLDVRARNLILRDAVIGTDSEGYFDVRAEVLTLEGASKIVSRAPASVEPPFSSSASVNVSAAAVEGPGHLNVESYGADYRRPGMR